MVSEAFLFDPDFPKKPRIFVFHFILPLSIQNYPYFQLSKPVEQCLSTSQEPAP